LVVCINPLVPYDNTNPYHLQESGRANSHMSEKGIQSVTGQTLRIFSYAGLHYHVKQLRRAHPQVDIILIEPQQNDYQMTFDNIMRYSTRLNIAHHGFETVTYDLAKDYAIYKEILSRHGIRVSRRLLIEELNEISQSNHDPDVIRKVLEASQVGCRQHHPKTPACQLSKALAELESILNDTPIASY
jgi:NTE family protein